MEQKTKTKAVRSAKVPPVTPVVISPFFPKNHFPILWKTSMIFFMEEILNMPKAQKKENV